MSPWLVGLDEAAMVVEVLMVARSAIILSLSFTAHFLFKRNKYKSAYIVINKILRQATTKIQLARQNYI